MIGSPDTSVRLLQVDIAVKDQRAGPTGWYFATYAYDVHQRLTKTVLAEGATSSAPAGLPVELPEHQPYLRLLTRGAVKPSPAEIAANPRAASARLRAAERIRATGGEPR